jgi:glycerol-3-phosphate dehydrogenase
MSSLLFILLKLCSWNRATGTGVALDAATRGLKTALVEKDDFSSGTSSRSSKLIHGGIRYLEKAFMNLDIKQYELVKDALRERAHLLECSPNLTRPLPIIVPIYEPFPNYLFWLPYYWAGVKFYDIVAGSNGVLRPSFYISAREALEKFPMLKDKGLAGGVVYYDGLQNDARMNVALALTSVAYGAVCLNHVEVIDFTKDQSGKINGAKVRNTLTGEEKTVKSKVVVNATGPFVDPVRKIDDKAAKAMVQPSSGVHLTLPDRYSPSGMGLIVPKTKDGRVLFLLPWEGSTIAGTTDAPTELTDLPQPTEVDIDWILEEVNRFLGSNVKRYDVDAAWSGIRPLASDPSAKNTESLVRDHIITTSQSGLVTITGGKWTTYRKMAQDVVDQVSKTVTDVKTDPCKTWGLKLIGAHQWSLALPTTLVRQGYPQDIAEHLAHNYGDKSLRVAAIAKKQQMKDRLVKGYPIIEAEIVFAVRHEYACTIADVLARRVRLAFLNSDACMKVLPRVADIMGAELSWDEAKKQKEIEQAKIFLGSMNRTGTGRVDRPEGQLE